jgi:hypothetical protein
MSDTLLSPDKGALESLERKFQVVRDHTTAVAKGFKTGLFLYGQGGAGKSYTVLRHLEALEAPQVLYNSRMTAKGLFLSLHHAPDAVHVLEDMERLTKDADAKEQERLYTERTGASRADFFRRKREVETGDFDEQDAGQ